MAHPPAPTLPSDGPDGLYQIAPAVGAAEVVVYSDDHAATLASLGPERVRLVVDVWAERTAVLGARDDVAYVFVFENRGEAVGVTLHHPHGQIYGFPDVPPVPAAELAEAARHHAAHGTCVVCDVAARERAERTRLVVDGDAAVAFVPFAARFPYEVHVVARRHAPTLADLGDAERDGLAAVLHRLLVGYDRLFDGPLPYVMAVHQAPTDGAGPAELSHVHLEFTPFLRAPDRLKHLAGSELGAGTFLNDVAPEQAAAALRRAVER